VGAKSDPVKPLLVLPFYLLRDEEVGLPILALTMNVSSSDFRGRHGQVGSLAGAAHLLYSNAGVLR
jgi:hypothetical protein